jgi:hypothetical protein
MFENVNKGSLANDYSIEILVSAMKDLASIMFSIVWFFFFFFCLCIYLLNIENQFCKHLMNRKYLMTGVIYPI